MPKAFAKPTAASRKHNKAVQEGDDNAEVAFSVPPSVKAALTRCASQGRERVATGRTAAAGGGGGNRNAQLAASGGFRLSPVTPSLTPYATAHSTVSASSEDGDGCHFSTDASANGSEENGDAGGGGGGGGVGLAPGRGDNGTGGKRNGYVGVAFCDAHAAEDNTGGRGVVVSPTDTAAAAAASFVGGSGEDIGGPRSGHEPGAPTSDEPLLGKPSGRHEPMGSGDIDKLLTRVLPTEGGDKNAGSDNLCIGGSGDVPWFSTSCEQDVGGDCCSKCSLGSAGGIDNVSEMVTSPFRRRGKRTP